MTTSTKKYVFLLILSNIDGIGLFTKKNIQKDEIITIYIGTILNKEAKNEYTLEIYNNYINGAESRRNVLLKDFYLGAHFLNEKNLIF